YSHDSTAHEDEKRPLLAFHAVHSGMREIAAASYLDLAQRAQTSHAYVDSESLFTQALAQLEQNDTARRAVAFKGRALMRYRVSPYDDALADFELALQFAQALGDKSMEIDVLLDEATALDWMEEYQRSRALVEQAEVLSHEWSSPLIDARLLM